MNDVSLEHLLMLIGGKEVDLMMLKQENATLRKRLSEIETRIAEPEKPKSEETDG